MHKWIKYDLHMHSQYSKPFDSSRVKEMSADDFAKTLLDAGIEVFSITDHNCFNADYYLRIKEYIKDKPIKIIPGCEFNIYIDKNTDEKFQANIYFSTSTNPNELEKTIADLYSQKPKPFLSDIIDALNNKEFTYIIFPEADKSSGISRIWGKVCKLGEENNFFKNAMQRIFRGYDSKNAFNKILADNWAFNYIKESTRFVETIKNYDDETINYIKGCVAKIIKSQPYEPKGHDKVIKELANLVSKYGSCFSFFSFSDWHNKEKYQPTHNNYIYGNEELPFESLELATLDPVSRVNVLPIDVTKPINEIGIKTLSFNMNGTKYDIDFSIGLNSIIGERASGKSLLMAILLKMYDKTNSKLNEYRKNYKVDLDSIKCTTFSGEQLNAGQLGSLKYIEQNTIADIFNNPSTSENGLKEYFAKIEDPDTSILDNLVAELKLLKVFNTNYKSISSYINITHTFDSYAFSNIKSIDTSLVDSYYNYSVTNLSLMIKQLKTIGLRTAEFDLILLKLKETKELLDKRIALFSSLITIVNKTIDEQNSENTNVKENMRLAKASFEEAKQVIISNFNALLSFKKIEYYINHFYVKVPKLKIISKSNYLFVSYCDIKPDLKDIVLNNICSSLIKQGTGKEGLELLRAYLSNNTTLKATVSSIHDNLEKKFISENISLVQKMFEIKNEFDYRLIERKEDLDEYIKNGFIEDVSDSSLGRKSIAYLELMLDSDSSILLFDQPEDNVDNHYLSKYFVPLIKNKKKTKQLIFITHNPSVAVYADSFTYIYASNNDRIEYRNYYIESYQDKEGILDILDGGSFSFSDRNLKYGDIKGEFRYAIKNSEN